MRALRGCVRRPGRSGRWRQRATRALVAASVVVTSLVGLATEARAASVTSVTYTADSFVAQNASAVWTVGFTSSGSGALVAGNAVAVRFPTGVGNFDISGATAAFATGFSGGCPTPTPVI